jgi:hypothetical protein
MDLNIKLPEEGFILNQQSEPAIREILINTHSQINTNMNNCSSLEENQISCPSLLGNQIPNLTSEETFIANLQSEPATITGTVNFDHQYINTNNCSSCQDASEGNQIPTLTEGRFILKQQSEPATTTGTVNFDHQYINTNNCSSFEGNQIPILSSEETFIANLQSRFK